MALQTWAALNAKNSKNVIPPPVQSPGLVQQASNFNNNLSAHIASFGEGILSPVTKMIASGAQALKSTPQILQAIPQTIAGTLTHDPQKKQALLGQANQNINQANATQAAPVNLGLQNGPQKTLGGSTTVQNLGTAAQAASFLTPATGLGPITSGAVAGGLQGGGQAAEDPNATATSVGTNTAVGAVLGAGVGAALKYGPDLIGKVLPKNSGETNAVEDTLSSRIKDATPAYDKTMVGKRAYLPDTTTPEGTVVKGENVPRVNEGKGLTGKRTVTTNAQEQTAGEELDKLKSYPDKGTALQKSQAVHDEISTESEKLRNALQAEDKATPLDAKVAKDQIYKNVFNNLDGDAKTAVTLRGKVGDFGKTGISESDAEALVGKGPRTQIGKYGTDVADAMGQYDGTREGLLNLRQKLDGIYQDYRGKQAWGTDSYNALDDMHHNIRDYLNKELGESTANTDTQASFKKQSNLFRAKDVLDNKAMAEATSKFDRFMQIHPLLKKIGTRGLMRIAIEVTGVSLAAATINKVIKKATSGK